MSDSDSSCEGFRGVSDDSSSCEGFPAVKLCPLLDIRILFWRGAQSYLWSGGRAVPFRQCDMWANPVYGEYGELQVYCAQPSQDVYNQLHAHNGLRGEPFPGIHAERRAVHAYCARLVASLEGLE